MANFNSDRCNFDEMERTTGFPRRTARRPIRRRKIYEEVAIQIEEMLRDGTYRVGDRLPSEKALMEEFGVGRSAVREALMSLNRIGLVEVSSGERALVTEPTAQSLLDGELSGAARVLLAQPGGVAMFQGARAILEIGLCRLAAQTATDKDLENLKQALEANEAAIGVPEDFVRTDVAFHYAIASISRSSIVISVHDAVVDWLMEQRSTALLGSDVSQRAYKAHARIYEAIARRDAPAAEDAMQAHLEEIVDVYWGVLAENEAR